MASSSKIQAPSRSLRGRKRLSILLKDARAANGKYQHDAQIYFEPDDVTLVWIEAGRKLRDWAFRCQDQAITILNTQHQDLWKVIDELYEAIKWNRAACIQLFEIGKDLPQLLPAFSPGWSSSTESVAQAV